MRYEWIDKEVRAGTLNDLEQQGFEIVNVVNGPRMTLAIARRPQRLANMEKFIKDEATGVVKVAKDVLMGILKKAVEDHAKTVKDKHIRKVIKGADIDRLFVGVRPTMVEKMMEKVFKDLPPETAEAYLALRSFERKVAEVMEG